MDIMGRDDVSFLKGEIAALVGTINRMTESSKGVYKELGDVERERDTLARQNKVMQRTLVHIDNCWNGNTDSVTMELACRYARTKARAALEAIASEGATQ